MNLRYAIKQFIKYRRRRKVAQEYEDYYRKEIVRQCASSCVFAGLRVTWYFQKGQVSASKLKDAGIDPEVYRNDGTWCARLTEEEGINGRPRAPRERTSRERTS